MGESLQRLAMAAFEHYVLEGSEVRGPWQHMIICAPQAVGIIWWLLLLFTATLWPLQSINICTFVPSPLCCLGKVPGCHFYCLQKGVAAAAEALAGLLPHLPVADAWTCLQQLAQPLTQQACGSEASEPCIARLAALRRCAEALLQAYASPGTEKGGAEGCAEQAGQAQAQAERAQAQTGPLIDASTDAGRQTQAQPELPPGLAASECAAWQQRAASLVVPALEFCAAHSDFAVQQVRCCRSMLSAWIIEHCKLPAIASS